jgi:hypothetical protein
VRIIGDMTGAAILMTDTPELFGGEIRAIGIIDMQDDKIVRWVDYWDGRGFGSSAVSAIRVPAESYPQQLGLDVVTGQHSAVLGDAVNALTSAIKSGDPALLEEQFTYDVVFEDLALRSIVRGRAAVSRYLRRGLGTLPYSTADVVHVVGSDHGGGFEWRAEGADIPRGAAALTLDATGKVSSLTFVWDGSLLDDPQIAALTALAVEPQR